MYTVLMLVTCYFKVEVVGALYKEIGDHRELIYLYLEFDLI